MKKSGKYCMLVLERVYLHRYLLSIASLRKKTARAKYGYIRTAILHSVRFHEFCLIFENNLQIEITLSPKLIYFQFQIQKCNLLPVDFY